VGFVAEPLPPKGFPLFLALGMASPDTIMLLIVDYHAAVGDKESRAPVAYAPEFQTASEKLYSLVISQLVFVAPECQLHVNSVVSYMWSAGTVCIMVFVLIWKVTEAMMSGKLGGSLGIHDDHWKNGMCHPRCSKNECSCMLSDRIVIVT